MLPTYVSSSAEKEKMNRHGYGGANGQARGAGAYPSASSKAGFSIRPDKYEKYARVAEEDHWMAC